MKYLSFGLHVPLTGGRKACSLASLGEGCRLGGAMSLHQSSRGRKATRGRLRFALALQLVIALVVLLPAGPAGAAPLSGPAGGPAAPAAAASRAEKAFLDQHAAKGAATLFVV